MGKKSAPSAPNPAVTSALQENANYNTAVANAFLQNMNEVTPDGTKTFNQTGTGTFIDPLTGQEKSVPTFTVTQTLSDQQQAIKDQQDAADLNLATLGNNLSGTLGEKLTGNFTLDNAATENRLFELGRQRLDPLFAQRDEDLRSRLANQGIKAGSAAYDREMQNLGQQQNDAYNQLLLTGRGQAAQELLTEDNQRINQISALLSGGQVSQPNFMTGNAIGAMPTTDVASIYANNFNNQMNAFNARMGQDAMIGNAIGSMGQLFALSDERAKKDIEPLGKVDGHNVYSYRYKGEGKHSPKSYGVLAQEAEKMRPDAVMTGADGFKRVNYGELFGAN